MKNLVEILKHIEDLYCVEDVDKKKIEQWLENTQRERRFGKRV